MKTKTCPNCNKEKLISKFYFRKDSNTYRKECKKCFYDKGKEYRIQIKEEIKSYQKQYYEENKEEIRKYQKEYNDKNKEQIIEQHKKYYNNKRKTDVNFKILVNLRSRLNKVLRRNSKSKSTIKLLGCSIEHLKQHLQAQFQDGMNWVNYGRGGWEVDHIRPCISFDLSKPSEQRKCFNYKNLQPLWAIDNLKKGCKT